MTLARKWSIVWKGKEHFFIPNMELLRSIEDKYSMIGMYNRTLQGDMPTSHIIFALTKILRSAGLPTNDDEVFAEYKKLPSAKSQEITRLIFAAFFGDNDEEEDAKNPEAQPVNP